MDCLISICLTFQETITFFSKVVLPFYIPISNAWSSSFSTSSSILVIMCSFNYSHRSGWYIPMNDISLWFDLHFPNSYWCYTYFNVMVNHSSTFLGKMSIHIWPIVLSSYYWAGSVVYTFWIQIPYQIYDVQVFLPVCGLSFHFLNGQIILVESNFSFCIDIVGKLTIPIFRTAELKEAINAKNT